VGDVSRPQLAVYAAAAIAIALIGARYLRDERGSHAAAGASGRPVPVHVQSGDAGSGGWATVQVAGAVRRPGVYRLRAGKRIDDAVRLAGGPTGQADLAGVNLAAKVEDGRQVIVPLRGAGAGGAASAAGGSAATSGAGAGGAPGALGAGGPKINLNTATVEQLDALDGIGPTMAQKILAYRQQHGGFRSVGELDQVPGIGEKRLAALKDLVTV
jgi:competence protein ComEA